MTASACQLLRARASCLIVVLFVSSLYHGGGTLSCHAKTWAEQRLYSSCTAANGLESNGQEFECQKFGSRRARDCSSAWHHRTFLEVIADRILQPIKTHLWSIDSAKPLEIPLWSRTSSLLVNTLSVLALFPSWMAAFAKSFAMTRVTAIKYNLETKDHNIRDMSGYVNMFNYFRDQFGSDFSTSSVDEEGHFWTRYNKTEPRLLHNKRWMDDRVFTGQRLAGKNPRTLHRVTLTTGPLSRGLSWVVLKAKLNAEFDFDSAMNSVVGCSETSTMIEAIAAGRIFAQHYPILGQIKCSDDAPGAYKSKMMPQPIVLFVLGQGDEQPTPFAIQLGNTTTSTVYTPDSGFFWWTVAKMFANQADAINAQIVHHLVGAHFISEAFAVGIYREMQEGHPMRKLLSVHFDGLVGINTIGMSQLINEGGTVARVAGFGHSGLTEYIRLAYKNWNFEENDFVEDLKRRGVDDPAILPYYPYRDDGMRLYKELRAFVTDYINIYYCSDEEVQADAELQAWIAFASKAHGGKGVPSALFSRQELLSTVLNVLWTNSAGHAAINYAIKEFGSVIPNMPFAIYMTPEQADEKLAAETTPENDRYLVKFLAPYDEALIQVRASAQLSSLKLSRLLHGYDDYLTYPAAKGLVATYKNRLDRVQLETQRANAYRRKAGLLPYRYLLPDEIPSSIVI